MPSNKTQAIDLRDRVCGERIGLAPRRESLDERRVLLFDNGKIGEPNEGKYAQVFQVLEAHLAQAHPGATVSTMRHDLLKCNLATVLSLVEEIADAGFDAVICALLDQGVTQPSVIFATELERRGIPVSLVCQGAGGRLARATSGHMAPGLPVSVLDMARAAAPDVVAIATQAQAAAIVAGLLKRGVAKSPATHATASAATTAPASARAKPALIELADADAGRAYTDLLADAGLGDGLPFFVPTPVRVDAMLAQSGIAPDAELWPVVAPRAVPLSAYEVAVLAVAAGCEPQWFKVVAAAYRAMAAANFRLAQTAITTHPGGTLVLVSGPEAEKCGVAGGQGSLGPGYRANASIGRTVALGYSFFLGARVQGADLSVQGSPAKYSYCFAENLAASPWPGLNADFFDAGTSCVTVLKCEGPRTFVNDSSVTARGILTKVAGTIIGMGGNTAAMPRAQIIVILNPGHAAIVAGDGWSKTDVQRYLFETARNEPGALLGIEGLKAHPHWFAGLPRYPAVERAEDFLVVVAGEPGPHSSVVIPWGIGRAISEPIRQPGDAARPLSAAPR